MANIKEWLVAAEQEAGETIEAIVVGEHDDDKWSTSGDRRPEHQRNVILSRADGLALLDEEYDSGYGGADCFPMYAWSASWVWFIGEYDGATGLASVPRNPVSCEPQFSGD